MGKLILIVLAALVLFMIVSAVISALHFLFWIAVVAVLIVGALRLTSGVRRRSRE
jgi:Flp pilus assembly protein TadB